MALTLIFDLLLKNFYIGNNFWMISDRAFIFHLCIPCDKTFPLIAKFLEWLLRPFSVRKVYGQGHEVKTFGINGKVLSQGIRMWNMKVLSLTNQKLCPMLKFWKVGQRSKSRSRGQKFWYQCINGLVTRNTHVKYESSTTFHSKVMSNVKVFRTNRQTNR